MSNINELIKSQQLDQLKAALESDSTLANQPDERGFTPLIMASYMNAVEAVKLLLSEGANVNGQDAAGNTALMGTCFKGFTEIAQLLLEHGAGVNIKNGDGASALAFAINFDQVEVARLLLQNGAVVDDSTKGMIAQARAKGNQEMLALFE